MPATYFQSTAADSELGIGARLGEYLLDLFSVELNVVEAEFGVEEVPEEGVADLGGVMSSEAAADVFVSLHIGGDVEGRGVSVVEVVEVGVEVGHVVHHQTWQLPPCSLHSRFSVVQQSEVRSADGSILIGLFDEGYLDVLGEVAQLALDGSDYFLHRVCLT